MTHLSPEELKSWCEYGRAEDRAHVIAHLAECERCRKALGALVVEPAPHGAATVVRVEDAVPLGYAARPKSAAPAGAGWAWLRPAYALTGAAAAIVAVLWFATPRTIVTDDAVRSSELTTLAPAGSTNTLEFKWASPFDAAKYRVTIRDAAGALVYSAETAGSSLALDEATRGRFATMVDYSWTVSALDPAGEIIAESKPRGFLYQP